MSLVATSRRFATRQPVRSDYAGNAAASPERLRVPLRRSCVTRLVELSDRTLASPASAALIAIEPWKFVCQIAQNRCGFVGTNKTRRLANRLRPRGYAREIAQFL